MNTKLIRKGIVFFDQAMVSGSNFLLGILLVRYLGLESYGVFTLLWMGVLFGLDISQAFITKPLLSITPQIQKKKQKEYINHLHWMQIFVGVLFLILCCLLIPFGNYFFRNEIIILLPIICGIVCCQILHDFYRKINFVKNRTGWVLILDIVLYIGQLIGVAILIFFETITLQNVLTVILSVNILSIGMGGITLGFEKLNRETLTNILLRHFHFSKWLLGTSILQWLSGNYFIIVGASILGTTAVGAIRMVQNIMGLCHVLFLAMENVMPIEAARQFHLDGENALIKYLIKSTWKLGAGFLIVLLTLIFFAPQILNILYGEEAIQHSYIVFVYVLLYVFVFLGHPFRFFLRTIEQTRPIFIAYVVSSLFSLFFANVLLNLFEMNGLLFGLIATQFLSLLTYFFFIENKLSNSSASRTQSSGST